MFFPEAEMLSGFSVMKQNECSEMKKLYFKILYNYDNVDKMTVLNCARIKKIGDFCKYLCSREMNLMGRNENGR